ncbi:unnamed protein product [Rotaria sp. Silwood2]|nr:unnamed protein product [Rotaria sp. Silwood2]
MDVNRDNFYDVLPEILNDINSADYVAMDGEFTGILALDKMNYFDTPAERYKRHYECDRHYLMIQVGLAMVRCLNPTENQYSLKAYNFYLFPENETDAYDFQSKSSSLQFLANNHFDFVQLFLQGIPFVCRAKHLEKLQKSQLSSSRHNNQQISNSNNSNEKKSEAMTNSLKQSESNNLSDTDFLKNSMTGFSEETTRVYNFFQIQQQTFETLFKQLINTIFNFDIIPNIQKHCIQHIRQFIDLILIYIKQSTITTDAQMLIEQIGIHFFFCLNSCVMDYAFQNEWSYYVLSCCYQSYFLVVFERILTELFVYFDKKNSNSTYGLVLVNILQKLITSNDNTTLQQILNNESIRQQFHELLYTCFAFNNNNDNSLVIYLWNIYGRIL